MRVNMIDEYIKQSQIEQQKLREELNSFHYLITDDLFWMMLKCKAEEIFAIRGVNQPFVVDDYNKNVIRQLYYYLIGDQDKCEWNIHKGIYMLGRIGCGKSILMYAYLSLQDMLTKKITHSVHAKQLIDLILSGGIEPLKKKPMFIDELGRENLETKDFGNVIKPVIDLFSIRYEFGGRTYATSNFTLDDLENAKDSNGKITGQRYGKFIRTRMDEMFNIVVLPGENRRLKWEK
ncbi:MAG: hypothetical protein RSO15_14785 [Bacteroides sp.]|uniref:hypothetical protein n=1 Tax=Bacteroides sp. TaxID=29523 RepID=UPI002FC86BE0